MGKMYGTIIRTNLSYGQAMHEAIVNKQPIAREHWGGYWVNIGTDDTANVLFTVPVLVAVLRDEKGIVPATPYNEDIQAMDWMIVGKTTIPDFGEDF